MPGEHWDRYVVTWWDEENGKALFTKKLIARHWEIEGLACDTHWPSSSCLYVTWDVEEAGVAPPPVFMVIEIAGRRYPQYDNLVRDGS